MKSQLSGAFCIPGVGPRVEKRGHEMGADGASAEFLVHEVGCNFSVCFAASSFFMSVKLRSLVFRFSFLARIGESEFNWQWHTGRAAIAAGAARTSLGAAGLGRAVGRRSRRRGPVCGGRFVMFYMAERYGSA